MKFGREKFALLIMKSGKRHVTEGMECSNQEKIRTLGEKETGKYLAILKSDTIKQVKMKVKIVASNIEQVLAATPDKAPTIWPPASHHVNYPS